MQYIKDKNEQQSRKMTAGWLGIEGLHALDNNITNVDIFYNAGVRMMAPMHFFDNGLGGSAHGVDKAGLTPFGVEVVKKCEELGVFLDVAHASEPSIRDILRNTKRPVVSSHTGVKGVCNNTRNLPDDILIEMGKRDGLVGVAFFEPAVCGENRLKGIVDTIKYLKDLIGVEHVGLGSDWDGAVITSFDAAEIYVLTDELLKSGFVEQDIRKIMGENVKQFLLKYLPVK